MIEKILLADSGAGQVEKMLKNLMEVPSIQRAFVTVLHVVAPQTTAEEMQSCWEEGGKLLAQAIQSLNLDPGRTNAILRQGEPKATVCQVAEELDTDLIIMGSRGLKRLQSILENSVSQYVFQLSSRPLLLVKDDIYVRHLNRIMVAMDNSPSSLHCLRLALYLLRDIKGGQLLLTHINPPTGTTNPDSDPVLARAIAEAKKYQVSYRCAFGSGKVGSEICRLSEELNADLLIIGSPDRRPSIAKGMPDLDRLLGASISDYVRIQANCPVLLARTSS